MSEEKGQGPRAKGQGENPVGRAAVPANNSGAPFPARHPDEDASATGGGHEAANSAERFYLTKLRLENFTAFRDIEIKFSPGVNVFIGENATGKTHILKVLYVLGKYRVVTSADNGRLVNDYFHLADSQRWNTRNQYATASQVRITVTSNRKEARAILEDVGHPGKHWQVEYDIDSDLGAEDEEMVFIPVKEMLSHAPGFLEMYERFELAFERQYSDVLVYAGSSKLREITNPSVSLLLERIESSLGGHIERIGQVYYLVYDNGFRLEAALVAEGHRKFGLIWLLLRNESIRPGNLLFIDEPEANLNPKLIGEMAGIILAIQRLGVQVFLATHSYLLVKELELQAEAGKDELLFHSLYRDEADQTHIRCQSAGAIAEITHNPILEGYTRVYDMQIEKAIAGIKNGKLD
jgi:predicted ATPase